MISFLPHNFEEPVFQGNALLPGGFVFPKFYDLHKIEYLKSNFFQEDNALITFGFMAYMLLAFFVASVNTQH